MLSKLIESKALLPIISVILLACGFLYSRTYTPAWPGDFVAYLGAGYAIAEGSNPYDDDSVSRSLSANGLSDVDNLPYLYSPLFALPFSAAKFIGSLWVRRLWFAGLHISFWAGLYLLVDLKDQRKNSFILMIILGVILLFTGPYRAAIRWGQVTVLLFLAVSLAISRKRESRIGGICLALIPFVKPALSAPIFCLKGKAWKYLLATTLSLIVLSVSISGIEPWKQYVSAIHRVSSEWDLSMPGNRSLTGNVHRVLGALQKADHIEQPETREERIERAGKQKLLATSLSVILTIISILLISAAIGRSRLKQFYHSQHLIPLLCWISPLISPLAYDHYGLFLLPLLIKSIQLKQYKLYIPVAIAFSYWALIPNSDSFISNYPLFLTIEAARPLFLVIASILYVRNASFSQTTK